MEYLFKLVSIPNYAIEYLCRAHVLLVNGVGQPGATILLIALLGSTVAM